MRSIIKIILILTLLFYAVSVNDYAGKFYQRDYSNIENQILSDLDKCNSNTDKTVIISYLKEWQEYQNNHDIYNLIPEKYQRYVLSFCSKNIIPVRIVYAVIQWESGWNQKCIGYNPGSKTIDIGLCQLNSYFMWDHARGYFGDDLKKFNPFNWENNLRVGLGLMNGLYKEYNGDLVKILVSYNAGRYYAVRQHIMPANTKVYVKKIKQIYYSV